MKEAQTTEFWMNGPIDNIPALLQPVAHTILQVQCEIHQAVTDFPESLLWEKPFGMASPAFHLQHIPGVLDRLFTYAIPLALNPQQFREMSEEGKLNPDIRFSELLERLKFQIDKSLRQLSETDPASLTDFRGVGRKQLPSTVLGLFFHAAEHSMRHMGQLMVTIACLKAAPSGNDKTFKPEPVETA